MSNPEYRLRVLSPDGTEKHVLTLDPPLNSGTPLYLDGGPRAMEVGPLGDCREAVFEGDPTTLGIGPRDTVQVQYRPISGTGTWLNRYAGTAVINGSLRSEVGRYKLQGFKLKRLNEVEARTLLVEADLGAQLRQLFTDLIASGQLGNSLQLPTLESIPDLNKTSAGIHGNYWQVARLIEQRLKGRSERTRAFLNEDGSTGNDTINPDWGVNADLRPVFGYPTGVLTIDEGLPGVEVDGMDLDSTSLVTDVRLIWTKTLAGLVESRTYQNNNIRDGTVYLDDVKAARPLTKEVAVAPRTYGQAWRSLPLPSDVNLFQPLPAGVVQLSTSSLVYGGTTSPGDPVVTGDEALLWDGKADTSISIAAPSGALAITYMLILNYPDNTPLPDGFVVAIEGGTLQRVSLVSNAGIEGVSVMIDSPSSSAAPLYLLPGATRDERLASRWAAGQSVVFYIRHTTLSIPVKISAACLVQADPALMLASAQPLARVPLLDPVECRVPGWEVNPAEQALIILRHPVTGVELSRVEKPIELLVYDTDEDGELFTRVRCGQRDDAEKLSFAASITERDSAASLDAVRSSG